MAKANGKLTQLSVETSSDPRGFAVGGVARVWSTAQTSSKSGESTK
ncbi:MAG: hypothetical protein QM811_31650 [Pirellulales bacterium]